MWNVLIAKLQYIDRERERVTRIDTHDCSLHKKLKYFIVNLIIILKYLTEN